MARPNPDTAQWAVVGMGAAILLGVFYLLLRDDPSTPPPTGSQVPPTPTPPEAPPPQPLVTVQATYSMPLSDAAFTLRVGDTVAVTPPSPGGDWGRPSVSSAGGVTLAAGISLLGPQPDGSYLLRADSPGQAAINFGYTTSSGTDNHSMPVTVTP